MTNLRFTNQARNAFYELKSSGASSSPDSESDVNPESVKALVDEEIELRMPPLIKKAIEGLDAKHQETIADLRNRVVQLENRLATLSDSPEQRPQDLELKVKDTEGNDDVKHGNVEDQAGSDNTDQGTYLDKEGKADMTEAPNSELSKNVSQGSAIIRNPQSKGQPPRQRN